jgi:hypothetical protein
MAKTPKSRISFSKMEQEEWHKPDEDRELNPLRALQSQPDFFHKHLAGAPNLKAVAALLQEEKPKK